MVSTASNAYQDFQGRIGRTFASSEPWWPPRATPPPGAPNVVIVLADDLGFSDLGCYGSEIATPNIDAIAAAGIRYANFHVTPLCSPTRAALMTGRNAHAVGMGYVANIDPGFPGYAAELPANQPSLAEVFRANGYATAAVGKWHLAKDSDLHEAGDRHSWPLQRGFDQYYGFLEALTNFHHPHRLYDGNSVVHVDQYPDGYYLTDDLTDRAVRVIREVKAANPAKPLFLYFAHGAVHAPLHAKPADIARHRDRYAIGWDRLREQRLARQKELGIVPPDTELPPRNSEPGEDVVAWDSLSEREQRLFARYMEVYAAMVDSIDQSVGRLRDTLAELGELDNTVFIFTSDNGASREGKDKGTTSYFAAQATAIEPGHQPDSVIDQALARFDAIGGPTTWPHYPRGWAMACNTPFRLYKITTYNGGHQVPFILSWPARLAERDQVVRRQYVHITDVLPTLVDLIGLTAPTERNGLAADALAGISFTSTIEDAEALSTHTEQYYECIGNRAYYRDGWDAVTFRQPRTPFSAERWQLYNVAQDPTQCHDVADQHPDRVEELAKAWDQAAWDNQVFPLDDGSAIKFLWRPDHEAELARPVTLRAGTPTLERYRSSLLIFRRSFRVLVDWRYRRGDAGVLVAHGGQEAGYVLYVEDDRLHFLLRDEYGTDRTPDPVALADTSGQVILDVHAHGGTKWDITLIVDRVRAATAADFLAPAGFLPFEGIDVGIDRRSPVSWELYERRGCFPFSGDLRSVTYRPGEHAPGTGPESIKEMQDMWLGLE
jgi:arylsulfatase A-like enzyme